jgi:DNA modification methylase
MHTDTKASVSSSRAEDVPEDATGATARKRANDLDGREWTRCSISVWRDIKRSAGERAYKHPAMFPTALVERLIQVFTRKSHRIILDPFCGSGSTLIAARRLGRIGVGFELSEEYLDVARKRLSQGDMFATEDAARLYKEDARRLREFVKQDSVDFAVTSPPYWDILTRKRSADYKEIRHYGNYADDLGTIADYQEFLGELQKVWAGVFDVLKMGRYFVINVMDLRKGAKFIPYHMDVTRTAERVGFELDDIIIWDRSGDYNNLRALGYPAVFRVNKVHEFLLIFRKPQTSISS